MARSDPEKLAQALRANLKRRKGAPPAQGPGQPGPDAAQAPAQALEKPPEKSV